jgi:hypothetical protein
MSTRFVVPVTVTISADSPEHAAELTEAFMHQVLPQIKPFSAKYKAEVGMAQVRDEVTLSEAEANAYDELAKGMEI